MLCVEYKGLGWCFIVFSPICFALPFMRLSLAGYCMCLEDKGLGWYYFVSFLLCLVRLTLYAYCEWSRLDVAWVWRVKDLVLFCILPSVPISPYPLCYCYPAVKGITCLLWRMTYLSGIIYIAKIYSFLSILLYSLYYCKRLIKGTGCRVQRA